jgi:hypothetical protein
LTVNLVVIDTNADSSSYARLARLDSKQLENVLRTLDFSNRFADVLKVYMDGDLLRKILARIKGAPGSKLLEAVTVIHEYYNRVIKLFYNCVKDKIAEDNTTPKHRRRMEYGEKVFLDLKQCFLNHLKFSLLDRIGYTELFEEFIETHFPRWKLQVDQAEFGLSEIETSNLDFVRRLLQESGLMEIELQRDNSGDQEHAFDSKVQRT